MGEKSIFEVVHKSFFEGVVGIDEAPEYIVHESVEMSQEGELNTETEPKGKTIIKMVFKSGKEKQEKIDVKDMAEMERNGVLKHNPDCAL